MRSYYIILLIAAALFGQVDRLCAQNYPLYNQGYFNPYFYNPSFAGSNDYTEVNVLYRKQWMGIKDAPELNAFALQYPTRTKISLGLNVFTEKAIALKSSSAMITFAYKVNISPESYLKFGMSGGIGMNNLDLNELSSSGTDVSNDPALARAVGTTSYLTGNFGVHYRFKNLTVGFAMPRIFKSDENDSSAFNATRFSQLQDQIYTINYKTRIKDTDFSIEPFLLYRKINKVQDIKEVSAMLHYKDQFWIGGGVRLKYGPMVMGGITIKDLFRIGYSYEIPTSINSPIATGSHEIHLKIRLGKNKNVIRNTTLAQTSDSNATEENQVNAEYPKKEEVEALNQDEALARDQQRVQTALSGSRNEALQPEDDLGDLADDGKSSSKKGKEGKEEISKSGAISQMIPGIYVVVGAFRNLENAQSYNKDVARVGFSSHIGYGKKGYYYVYVYSSIYADSARKMRDQIRQIKDLEFHKAWILEID